MTRGKKIFLRLTRILRDGVFAATKMLVTCPEINGNLNVHAVVDLRYHPIVYHVYRILNEIIPIFICTIIGQHAADACSAAS